MQKRIGIIGYGVLGQFLAAKIQEEKLGELCFIINRSTVTISTCKSYKTEDISPGQLENLILEYCYIVLA